MWIAMMTAACYEPFQSWLDENMIPILDEVDPIPCAPVVPAAQPVKLENVKSAYCLNQPSPQPLPDTRSLMMEFETVFAGMTPGQLTPPQSPPRYAQFAALEPVYQQTQQPQTMVYMAPQEVAHELAVVEELVRTRAENMVQWEGPVSPSSSSNSNFGDCSSSSDDPEWIPEVFSDQESSVGPAKNSRRRSSKPYSRVSPEDRKSRKKEQKKNAATRYRMKKKAEVEEILEEERGLMKHHDKLTEQISDLNREITYLKKLMRDFCKAKGLIP